MFKFYKASNLSLLRVHVVVKGVCSCRKLCGTAKGKHPAAWAGQPNSGVNNANTTWEASDFEGFNVGIACGRGLIVVDIDPRNGGHLSWHELSRGQDLPQTWNVKTGGSGTHIYYRVPEGRKIHSMSFQGIDFQYNGRYVIAPPSIHPNGSTYDFEDSDPSDEIAQIPPWLLDWLEGHQAKQQETMAPKGATHTIEPHRYEWPWIRTILEKLPANIGYQNWLGVGMGLHATGHADALGLFEAWSRTDPEGFKEGECARKWVSFSKVRGIAESHTYRWIFAMADLYNIAYAQEEIAVFDSWFQGQKFPAETALNLLENTRVLIQELADESGEILKGCYDYLMKSAYVTIPEFALSGALQALATCAQGSYRSPRNSSLNLYQWCAAPAGGGKDSYLKNSSKLVATVRSNLVSPSFGSLGGMRVALLAYNSRSLFVDEFHDEYINMTNTRNEYSKALLKEYKSLWNVPKTVEAVIIKASSTPGLEYPAFSLSGYSTVIGLKKCSSEEFLTSGLGSRFLFWVVDGCRPHNPERSDDEPKPEIVTLLREVFKKGQTMVGKNTGSDSIEIAKIHRSLDPKSKEKFVFSPQTSAVTKLTETDEGRDFFVTIKDMAIVKKETFMKNAGTESLASLFSRKPQHIERMASLRCLSDKRTEITKEDYMWAERLIDIVTAITLDSFAVPQFVTNADDNAMRRVQSLLRVIALTEEQLGKRDGLTKKEFMARSNLERRTLDDSLLWLVETGSLIALDKMGRRVYPEKVERGMKFCTKNELFDN